MNGINVICRADVKVYNKNLPCVAVDAGLFYCLRNNLDILIAIGDFDSIAPEILASYQGEIIKVSAEKDQSDLELALDHLKDAKESLYVYGALGGRMDHCLVNLKLCYYSDLDLYLIDEQNIICRLDRGLHHIADCGYTYVSFIAFENCTLSLTGFKYPLCDYYLAVSDNLTLSNEIVDDVVAVETDKPILMIFSNDKPERQNEDPAL